ncbi:MULTISPECIES: acyltransferase [unclassified Mesorhizobium]|uniref:acyltransferase family protein n=1 Tax=unclassified Mesorhizobium TaxID=325217 RepID=UPI000BAEE99C|nr:MULTISPECIES: acyltransferase [unclassified Mesorhizobium]TGT60126.1 acyltransferase [Mesorhizobium sp. M00.F.Ca.ET.170.01.1.1]AZO08287.1 acyltransferase [Mesorhizobium sp. M3A.F.Ca.ET.080.04.2.1]PBB85620.1 acyltransferase [Mesorhizobium sp. WSM3876]RWB72294.1 MAG: acyltransferase [Mesorhizobium sp.]RWB89304.1 MAG: acyltransferase [Mesorhizobium sp.]
MTEAALLNLAPAPAAARAGTVAGERFKVLDSWRGICALLVALFHFPTTSMISRSTFVGGCYLFVDFFFVLSGFVIAGSYASRLGEPGALARFALVRFGRIYPLHLVMLAAFAAFETLRLVLPALRGTGAAPFTGGFDLRSLAANVFLLQGMGVEDHLSWNAPSWSISAEFFAYLLFAAVVFAASGRAWIWFIAAAMTAPLFLLAFSTRHMDVSFDFGFIRCLYGFSLGALLAWFQHDSIAEAREALADGAGRIAWTLAELAMIAVIGVFVSVAGSNDAGIAAPVVFALALYLFAHEGGWISSLLRSRPMLLLGSLSYSIYMVHIFVQARMINVGGLIERKLGLGIVGDIALRGDQVTGFGLGSPWIGFAALMTMLIGVIVSSWFTWRFVEMPALAWFRRLAKRV